MTSVLTAKLPSLIRSTFSSNYVPQLTFQRLINISSVDYKARAGTREKLKKKKVKVEVKKLDFYAKLALAKDKDANKVPDKPIDDSVLSVSCDDVFEISKYKRKVYSLEEAIQSLREINDPSVYNNPNGLITARIELNMQAAKKTRTLDNFSKIALINHGFLERDDRKILIFCKDQEMQEKALSAGANLSGGVDLVKNIQKGELKLMDYRYILTHPDMLIDIVPLRGLMRKRFPNAAAGSVDSDIVGMIQKFINGIEYKANKHDFEHQFGLIETPFGKLSMPTEQLVDNFIHLLKDVDSVRPKRDGMFVNRCFFQCEPTKEVFRIDPFLYIESGIEGDSESEPEQPETKETPDDSDDEEKMKVAKKA